MLIQCSHGAHSVTQISFNSLQDYCSKSTTALAISKFYVGPLAIVCAIYGGYVLIMSLPVRVNPPLPQIFV